jgi:hypothetical protein
MQAGVQLAKVVALTLNPDFVDVYGDDTVTFKPNNVGEMGFMADDDAAAAELTHDVMIMVNHTVSEIETAIGGRMKGRVAATTPPPAPAAKATPVAGAVAGLGTATVTLTFTGGPASAAQTVTLAGLAIGTDTITGLTVVSIAKGDTVAVVATKVATMLSGKKDAASKVTLAATAAAGKVTLTEVGGGLIAAGATMTVA